MSEINLADNHLISSAAANAERAALSLFAIASSIYPGDNEKLVNYFIRETIEAGITLALHARKIVELCHLEDVRFDATRWRYEFDHELRETSFRQATNRFVHAKQLRVRTLRHPERIFGNDIVITEFIIATDRQKSAYVDVFGFAWGYLSQVAPMLGLPGESGI